MDSILNLENKIKKRIKIWKGDLKIVNKAKSILIMLLIHLKKIK